VKYQELVRVLQRIVYVVHEGMDNEVRMLGLKARGLGGGWWGGVKEQTWKG